ncbi:MAG TPA: asparagine synthase (glutamine-hydrolyzing), partial [Chitinophagaceae bacterium]|nr:asparagine synthase (glutamine-hydrolyzing) [Chitinophagaceae bacterium]
MCGITGKINFDRSKNIDIHEIKQMTDSIRHRGPDDEGFYIQQNVGLGFRRLSIIDLNTGHQPLANEDESIWIIFNGEIYNYQELHDDLVNKGHVFKTKSDTETIVHLYEQYGAGCLKFLRGMFGFSIWDSKKQQLFCARDRFGIKPFYYYTDEEKFVFGSEIKPILKAGNVDRTLSYDALDSYLAFGYITSDLSIYRKVKKLQPGHYLLLSLKDKISITTERYWEIQFEPDHSKTEAQWSQELEACLSETVRLHMISDVPLGAFLSGGIDSSSVVAMMARNSSRPIKTFSIGFKEQKFNELIYANEIAKQYGCEHHEQIVEPESVSLLPKLVNAYDEPYADSSAIPTYYVSKMAREYVTVALSGDGGDE